LSKVGGAWYLRLIRLRSLSKAAGVAKWTFPGSMPPKFLRVCEDPTEKLHFGALENRPYSAAPPPLRKYPCLPR
jgi:hypothetical protein